MKLIKCHIEGFGGLRDFTYEFRDGLNTICEENGWGKTTLGVFIKSIFYGLEYSARKKLADNERKKYAPWQGGSFGGSLDFAVGEKEYTIERYFGKRDKDDTFCLYDKKTGLPSRDYSENIGEELFHIDVESYERSTYIPQNAITISMTDSINAKLSNLVENGNDINNYENAYARLEERLKEYKKTGGRGLIPQLQEQIFAKQEQITECESKARGMAEIEVQIKEQKRRRSEFLQQKEEIRTAIVEAGNQKEQLAKKEHYDTLRKREAEIICEKSKYDTIFAASKPEEMLIFSIGEQIEELQRIEELCAQTKLHEDETGKLSELDEFFAAGCPDSPEIEMYLGEGREYDAVKEEQIRIQARVDVLKEQEALKERRQQEEEQRRREEQKRLFEDAQAKAGVWQRVLLTAGILLFAAGIAGCWLSGMIGLLGLAAGIICLVLAVTRKSSAKKQMEEAYAKEKPAEAKRVEEDWQEELQELLGRLRENEENQRAAIEHYQAFISQFPFADTEETPIQLLTKLESKAAEYHRLSEKEQELRAQKEQLLIQKKEKELALRERFGAIHESYAAMESVREAFEALKKDSAEYTRLSGELAKSKSELQEFAENNKDVWQKLSSQESGEQEDFTREEMLSLETLRGQEQQYEHEIEAIDAKIHSYRKDLDALSVIADRQTEFEEELEHLRARLEEAEYKAGILEKTMQYLKEAKESFSTHYMGKMRGGFAKYAAMLSADDGGDIRLDVQLNARIEAGGALRGDEYFSTGNRDFIGICIRLALVEALFEKEKPFLILDDPFVNLDDQKVANARKLLEQIAGEYQVLYLVCHSSRT